MASPWVDDISGVKTPFRFIVRVSQPHMVFAVGALMAGACASSLNAVLPLIYQRIVEAISAVTAGGHSYKAIWLAALMYVGIFAFQVVSWRVVGFCGGRWATGLRATSRFALISYLISHSHRYFEDRFAGSIAGKVHQAADGARGITQGVFWDAWPLLIGLAVSFFIAFKTSVVIGGLFLLWLLIVIPLNIYFSQKRLPFNLEFQKIGTKLRGVMVDIIGNIRAVQEYARGRSEMEELRGLMLEHRKAALTDWNLSELIIGINGAIHAVFMLLMVGTSVYLASIGVIPASAIILVVSMVFSVGYSILFVGNQINSLTEHWGEIREGLEDILGDHEVPDSVNAKKIEVTTGELQFQKASFAYHEGEAVLADFNLTIPAGQKVGLIGKSGAGKTTLAKLLLRHYDLTDGAILVDGQNIAEVTLDSLREAIAIVPQEPLLFHRSIKENIAYGNPTATDADIYAAAELAQSHAFIERLPDGYDTLVGERGVKLSGGQRQRVAIARAILKNAPILVLDEATSSLDSESEVAIQKALHTLMQGKTVIAVAHRLSTLREMDRLIVLDQGVIVEDGSHEELIAKGGIYAELWGHQSGGYLKDE